MSEVEIKKVEEQTAPVAATEEKPAVAEEKAPAAKKSSIINASVKPEDFDWDAFEGGEGNSPEDRKAIEEAYDKTLSKVVENEVVEGEVTAVTKREVVVNIMWSPQRTGRASSCSHTARPALSSPGTG